MEDWLKCQISPLVKYRQNQISTTSKPIPRPPPPTVTLQQQKHHHQHQHQHHNHHHHHQQQQHQYLHQICNIIFTSIINIYNHKKQQRLKKLPTKTRLLWQRWQRHIARLPWLQKRQWPYINLVTFLFCPRKCCLGLFRANQVEVMDA